MSRDGTSREATRAGPVIAYQHSKRGAPCGDAKLNLVHTSSQERFAFLQEPKTANKFGVGHIFCRGNASSLPPVFESPRPSTWMTSSDEMVAASSFLSLSRSHPWLTHRVLDTSMIFGTASSPSGYPWIR